MFKKLPKYCSKYFGHFLGMLYLLVCNRRVGKLCKKVQGVGRLGKSQSKNIEHAYIVLFRFSIVCQIASMASCSCIKG